MAIHSSTLVWKGQFSLVLPQSPASLKTWKINVSAWKQSLKRHNWFEKWVPRRWRVNGRGLWRDRFGKPQGVPALTTTSPYATKKLLAAQQVQSLSPLGCLQTACAEKLLNTISSRGRRTNLSAQPLPIFRLSASPYSELPSQVPSQVTQLAWWLVGKTSPARQWPAASMPELVQGPQGGSWPASGGKSAWAHRGPRSLSGKQVRLRESDWVCTIILYSRSLD